MTETSSILVVDDSEGICKTLTMILQRKGFDVTCAMDGPGAIEKVRGKPFNTILLDIRLPGMDGVEVNKHIQSLRPHSRVAMMTAYADDKKVQASLEAGAEKVFIKPLDMDTIIKYLQAPFQIKGISQTSE